MPAKSLFVDLTTGNELFLFLYFIQNVLFRSKRKGWQPTAERRQRTYEFRCQRTVENALFCVIPDKKGIRNSQERRRKPRTQR